MLPVDGGDATLRRQYVSVEFSNIILTGSAESVKTINQLISQDPTLVIKVNAKITRTNRKPAKNTQFDLPVTDVVTRDLASDRKRGQSGVRRPAARVIVEPERGSTAGG